VRTAEQVRAEFHRRGISIAEWARQHKVDQSTTYQVLYGTKKGRRGEAHRVAVLLGIKEGVIS
jgi:gp16 family phage-associated protein